MKAESNSHKRFLLVGVLPFALMITALPLIPLLVSPTLRNIRGVVSHDTAEHRPGVSPNTVLEEKARRAALMVVRRWESESRHENGLAVVSAADLQRLRHALQ